MPKKINLKKNVEIIEKETAVNAPADIADVESVADAPETPAADALADVVDAPADDVTTNAGDTEADADADADAGNTEAGDKDDTTEADAGEEKKARKERAKIDTTPLHVEKIVTESLAELLPAIVKSLGDREDAEELARAQLFGAAYGIVKKLVGELQEKYIAYAKRSYMSAEHWQVWDNTRKVCEEQTGAFERELSKLYNVTDANVYKLVESNCVWAKNNALTTIQEFLPFYLMDSTANMDEQLKALTDAGVNTVLVNISVWQNPQPIIKSFMSAGYMLAGFENIPAREFFAISKKFKTYDNLYKFQKMN